MKSNRLTVFVTALMLGLFLMAPARAEASLFRLWVEGRGDFFGGTSDLFTEFDYPVGGGLELGIEFFEITLFGEGIFLGTDQFLSTVNLGLDFAFGEEDETRFMVGFYTGPMFFKFPAVEPAGTDLSGLSPAEQQVLLDRTGGTSIDQVEGHFDQFVEQEQEVGSLAVGWNLLRLRLAVDYPVVSLLYLGLAGQLGYHMVISGEEVAAGARNEAVDAFAAQYGVPVNLRERIRSEVGASPVDTTALNGFNYDIHIYVRVEFEP